MEKSEFPPLLASTTLSSAMLMQCLPPLTGYPIEETLFMLVDPFAITLP